ncbi:MAG: hypothetical protein IJN11_05265 [Oscillospiraceae bacterium]|nr:hypothetical protein [Oscillospiraceae bacterium]
MIPLWMQLTAAVSSALTGFVMGIALLPFLRKMQLCLPEEDEKEISAGAQMKPAMCGLLAVTGCLGGLALHAALYLTLCRPDRTSASFHEETMQLLLMLLWAVGSAGAGLWTDFRIVRRKRLYHVAFWLRAAFVFTSLLFVLMLGTVMETSTEPTVMDFGFRRWDAGILYYPITAAIGTICWLCAADTEETQGASLTTGGILLLGLTILLLSGGYALPAILSLTAAGGCIGNLFWNLHPFGGHIGRTGSWWLAGLLTGLCMITHQHSALVLISLVYLINRLPVLAGKGGSLQKRLQAEGRTPWQIIAVLSVFAVFSAAAAVYVQR